MMPRPTSSSPSVHDLVAFLIENRELKTSTQDVQRDLWYESRRELKRLDQTAAERLDTALFNGGNINVHDILNVSAADGVPDLRDHGAIADLLQRENVFVTMRDTDEVFLYNDGVYLPGAESIIRARVEDTFRTDGESAKQHFVSEVIAAIRRRTYRDRKDFNPSGKLCLLNGILNVDTLTVEAHDKDVLFVTQLPVSYDTDATCPRFDKFLMDVLPDEDARRVVQMMAGYLLEVGNPLQKAFMLVGSGNNGKSTLLTVLTNLLGIGNISAEPLQSLSENNFAAYNLWGKLANICADIPSKAIRYAGVFKELTGGDPVRGERKFRDAFTFINNAKLLFSANELPEVNDRTYAFWRR